MDRFVRQRGLSGFGDVGQSRLEHASVAVVGVGGLGCPAAMYLAAAGVGSLTLIDSDRVSVTNLHRQVLFTPKDVDQPKVEAGAARLRAQAPDCQVVERQVRLTEANVAELLTGHDVIVDCTDTMGVRRVVEAQAHEFGVPVVWGAVQGWHGQVTVFAEGRRLDEIFPGPDALDLEVCDGGAVYGPVCGQVGTAMAAEAVRLASGGSGGLVGSLGIVDARTGRWRHVTY